MRCRKQVFCFDKGKGLKLSVIAKDQVIFIEKRLNLLKRLQPILDLYGSMWLVCAGTMQQGLDMTPPESGWRSFAPNVPCAPDT